MRTKLALLLMMAIQVGSQVKTASMDLLLRGGIEVENGKNELSISWINKGTHSFLINIGGLLGAETIPNFRLFIEGKNLGKQRLIRRDPQIIKGRIDPWVVVLPAGAEYKLRLPTDRLVLARDGQLLADFKQSPWVITVEYTGGIATDHAPGGRTIPYSVTEDGPTTIPFWVGATSVKMFSAGGVQR